MRYRAHHLARTLLPLTLTFCAAAQPARPDSSTAVRDFEARLAKYMQIRSSAPAAEHRKATKSPVKLKQQRNEIAARVLAARPDAKQGDIFTPQIVGYFRQQIATTLSGSQGARIRSSLRHAEPVKGKLEVNQAYPSNLPLQSTPATLLLNLPELPKDLEYRIVGHDLVLRDIGANLVVDFIPDVLPKS